MKKLTKKSLFAGIFFFSTLLLSFATETGGLFSNNSDISNRVKDGDLKLLQKNGLNLWLRKPLTEDGLSYFAAEGEFKTEYDFNIADSDKKLTLIADLNLFKFVLKKEYSNSNLELSAGRFFNADLSTLVYAQNGDGAKLTYNSEHYTVSAFAAYTGLLNAKNVTILEIENSPDLSDKKKPYIVANKYLIGALTFSLPNLLAQNTLSLEGFSALSLESKKYNRFYATAALTGPIVSKVFYNVSSTFGFAKYDEDDMEKGNLSKISISAYPGYKSMSLSLNGVYASGSSSSDFKAFQGFTSVTADNSLAESQYSCIAKAGLSATIKPKPNLLLDASGDIVFDTAAGDDEDEIKTKGFQYNAGFTWQVVSDVSLGAGFIQFIGTSDYEDQNKTMLKIRAAVAF